MFKEKLKQDLQGIFEADEIVFDSIENGEKLGVLYVEIEDPKTTPKDGNYYFKVAGKIGKVDEVGLHKYGFFHDRIRQCELKLNGWFFFGSKEDTSQQTISEGLFLKSSLSFIYRVEIPYDVVREKITEEKTNISLTIGV